MCGICGIWDLRGRLDLRSGIRAMTDILAHRGPDDWDTRLYRSRGHAGVQVALGHRRLAIIDLSPSGHQPMEGPEGLTAVVFNGEIYNFRAKRSEIPGYPYRSSSDTELILATYDKYGENFVEHLDGMFAFALWDAKAEKLLLARDRVGKKPLYYHSCNGMFAFASEIKSLLALEGMPVKMDPSALPLYLTFGYVPSPGTFYDGIKKLAPGTLMVVEPDGSIRQRAFWQYPLPREFNGVVQRDVATLEEELRALVHEAVARRLISDVPLGAFLSGGIDSSIVVGTMSRLSKEPVKTFSIGFEGDPTFDETGFARLVARSFRTQHTEFRVRPRAVDLIQKLVWHYDEPFGDSSAIPTFIVSSLARQHVTVALSGDGGDELFAGYERFAAALWTEILPKELFAAGRFLARYLPAPTHVKNFRRRVKRFFEKSTLPLADRYLEWNSFFTRPELKSMLGNHDDRMISESFDACFREAAGTSPLKRLLYLNFKTYLLDDLLVKTDRMSMSHGLEVRCPFLDTRLIMWACNLDDRLKIRGRRLKYILRHAFRDMLPEAILKRGKMGFGVPLGDWMRNELRDYSRDMLLGVSARIQSLIDHKAVEILLQEHLSRRQDHGQRLWALLTLEVWLRNMSRPGKT